MPYFTGSISNPVDIDTFEMNLVAGRTYYFELLGSASGGGDLDNPVFSLFRGNTPIGFNNNGGIGDDSRFVYTPTQSGTYQMQVAGYLGGTGSYTFLANEDDARNTVEGVGAAPVVVTGGEIGGELHYDGDTDLFDIALIDGLRYVIDYLGDSTGDGTLIDLMILVDDEDQFLAWDDDDGAGFNSRIAYTADYTGTHFLAARAYDDASGTFRLAVSQGEGGAGADTVSGTSRADAVYGAGGSDAIAGNGGADILRGGSGDDTLAGGTNADTLIGGTGADVFVFAPNGSTPGTRDIVLGNAAPAFEGAGNAAGDRFDLSALDANAGSGGNQAFLFGGTGAGRISLVNDDGDTVVRGNTDTDGAYEFLFRIEDGAVLASAYTAADFIL